MHDPIFAGYQLQWLVLVNAHSITLDHITRTHFPLSALDASINTDPDIVDMSLGYATHLIADLVGFDTTYGYRSYTHAHARAHHAHTHPHFYSRHSYLHLLITTLL